MANFKINCEAICLYFCGVANFLIKEEPTPSATERTGSLFVVPFVVLFVVFLVVFLEVLFAMPIDFIAISSRVSSLAETRKVTTCGSNPIALTFSV